VCTILIAEDHPDTRDAMALELEGQGHAVYPVADGIEALNWLRSHPDELPCLLLLDLRMPRMDGWDLSTALRAKKEWAKIPVIVVSATVHPDAPTPVIPAKAFWSKPPEPSRLAAVQQYCDAHRC